MAVFISVLKNETLIISHWNHPRFLCKILSDHTIFNHFEKSVCGREGCSEDYTIT